MTYTYICEKCNFEKDIDLPIGGELPKELPCEECKKGGKMKHDFVGQVKLQHMIFPHWMKAVNEGDRLKYVADGTDDIV
jgi:hypothetical protein